MSCDQVLPRELSCVHSTSREKCCRRHSKVQSCPACQFVNNHRCHHRLRQDRPQCRSCHYPHHHKPQAYRVHLDRYLHCSRSLRDQNQLYRLVYLNCLFRLSPKHCRRPRHPSSYPTHRRCHHHSCPALHHQATRHHPHPLRFCPHIPRHP